MSMAELQFTERIPIRKLRGVYLLWRGDEVVYVGQSVNIQQRIGVHLANPKKDFDAITYAIVESGDLNEIEAELIVKFNPCLNNELPRNNKYVTKSHVKKHWGLGGWDLRKILKGVNPVWRDYYLASDIAMAR